MIQIGKAEFEGRIKRIQAGMERKGIDALLVYGDEYRKENLRYVTNFWPIFERGACFIGRKGGAIYAGAPEGERYVREMCVLDDIRNIREFACVSVPEEIDYPQAKFTSLGEILREVLAGGKKLGVVGLSDMPETILKRVREGAGKAEVVDGASIVLDERLIKSKDEIACLREAGRLACAGYEKLMETAVPGNTELQAAGAAEGTARAQGAEAIIFMVMGTGPRVATIIGRPVKRVIRDGDMVMAALAVQYEGYVSTVEYPFVAGKASDEQRRFLEALFEAADEQLKYLRDGVVAGNMVRAVRDVFRKRRLEKYDVYPPMHGIGLAEAESPYPDEKTTYKLRAGMCVNSDISLFGHADGSNRIEEGFVITAKGPETITPYIREMVAKRAI